MGSRSEVRNGMKIDWDVPITMDDGIVLRADVYCPPSGGSVSCDLELWPFYKGYPDQS